MASISRSLRSESGSSWGRSTKMTKGTRPSELDAGGLLCLGPLTVFGRERVPVRGAAGGAGDRGSGKPLASATLDVGFADPSGCGLLMCGVRCPVFELGSDGVS